MPNYSHGTKLTLAAVDEPPYLMVGTDVSAKYKGAFCEAKIIDVNKHVKLRVLFDGDHGSHMINDTELKPGSNIVYGKKVEARHPEKKQQVYLQAVITKVLDQSRYTVVFDDGDQCILRRNSICLKSGKHFAESETLDQLPLTNPEHFGNPVKVGQASLDHNNQRNSMSSHQQGSNQTTSKLSNNVSSNNNNSTNNGSSKNGCSDLNNQTNSAATSNGRIQNSIKLETDKPTKGKSMPSSATLNTTNSSSLQQHVTAATTPGRRGGGKGRKRRESTTSTAKQSAELNDVLGDDSQDSAEVEQGESNVKYELIEIGVKLMVQYGKGKVQNVYEAKVNKIETNSAGIIRYYVHYTGWNNRYDEWITKNRILSIVTDRENGGKEGRSRQQEPNIATATNATTASLADAHSTREPPQIKDKEKDKEKEVKATTKTPRRSRQVDIASSVTATTTTPSTQATTSTNAPIESVLIVNSPTKSNAAPQANLALPKEKEKDKTREKDPIEPPSKTRRSRVPLESTTSASIVVSQASPVVPEIKVVVKQEEEIKEKEKPKDKKEERTKDKDASTVTKSGRPRQSDAISSNPISAAVASIAPPPPASVKDKEPTTKTRRSRQVDSASSTNATISPSSVSSANSSIASTPPRSEISQNDRERVAEREKETNQTVKEGRPSKQQELANAPQRTNNWSPSKERHQTKDAFNIATKTRGSKQLETSSATSSASLASTAVSSSSISSVSSTSTITTTTSSLTTATSTSSDPSRTSSLETIVVPVSSTSSRERERDKERDRDRDKEPPTKIRRSRQTAPDIPTNSNGRDISVITTTNNATTTTIVTSASSSTSSTASSSSSSYSMTITNPALSALVSLSEKEREKFDEPLIIDEPDCDKRISILQDKIMTIRQTYMALKAELADLDRRRKRPRMDRSSTDHINNQYNSVTCRN